MAGVVFILSLQWPNIGHALDGIQESCAWSIPMKDGYACLLPRVTVRNVQMVVSATNGCEDWQYFQTLECFSSVVGMSVGGLRADKHAHDRDKICTK